MGLLLLGFGRYWKITTLRLDVSKARLGLKPG
jgi:hypothetical protein